MKPFYISQTQPGIVRGGFFEDDLGGMLVGSNAREVCDALNGRERLRTIERLAGAVCGDARYDEQRDLCDVSVSVLEALERAIDS